MKKLAIDLLLFAVVAIGLAALMVWLSPAHGESCAATYGARSRVVVNEHAIVYPSTVSVVATPVVAVVPQYSAQYAGLPPEVLLLLQQMGARLDSIDRQLTAPQVAPPLAVQGGANLAPPAPTMPTAVDAGEMFSNGARAKEIPQAAGPSPYARCASCHSGTAAKGGNHVLFAAGQPLAWDCGQIGEIMDRVTRGPKDEGAMPPDGSDLDVGAIILDCKARLKQQSKR